MSRSSSPQNIESSKVSPIQIEQHEISTSPIAQSTEERGHDIHIDESSLEDQGVSHHHGDDNEYYVGNTESILAHRYKNGKIHYLVRWDGYPFYESSWEPEENLATAYHFLNDYRSHLERVQRGSSPSFDIETFDRGQEEYYQNKADEQDGSHSDCEPMDVLTTSEAKKSQLISLTSPEPRSVSRPSKAFSKLRAEHHRAIGPMKVKPLVPPARHHSPPKISIPASSLQKSRAPAPSTRQQHRTKRHVFKRGFFRKRKKEPAPDFSAVELVRPGNFTVAKKRRVSQDNHDPCVTVKSSLPNPTISLSQLPSFKKRPKAANEDDNTTLHPQSPESDRAENTGNLRILRELPSPHQQPLSVAPLPITEPPKETPKADVKLNPPTGPRQGRRSLSMQQYKQINRLNRTMSLDREDIANAGHHATPATTIPQIETKNLKPAEIPQGQNSSIWDGWWGNEGNHARAPTSADTTWNPAIWDPSVWGNQSTRRNSRPCSGHGFGKTMAVSPTDIDRPVSLDNPPRGPRSFDLQRPVDKPAYGNTP
ncbi:Chromodomain Y-like protein, partial [Neolecta irregularis DAH-3]